MCTRMTSNVCVYVYVCVYARVCTCVTPFDRPSVCKFMDRVYLSVYLLSELSLSTNYIHYGGEGVWKTMRNFFFLCLYKVFITIVS